MLPGLSHSLAIYAGLQAAGGILPCLIFLRLWRRFRRPHWRAWSIASGSQALAALVGLGYFRAQTVPWLAALIVAETAFVVLTAIAAYATIRFLEEMQHLRDRGLKEQDRLTGLLNQAALASRMESTELFHGVVAVCDVDNFKAMNDRFGHLAGDEILRNIGQLLRASVRAEDEAFRWGGDEFVVLFLNQEKEMARRRMQEVEQRLRGFQVRGSGRVPISISWGTSEAHGMRLRDTLDAADQEMYAMKRRRAARPGEEAAGAPESAGG